MQTLHTLKKEGKTILIVHHDLSKVPAYFDQIIFLHRKLIAFGKTEDTFTKENLHAAYGHELFIGGGVEWLQNLSMDYSNSTSYRMP